jgi:hypothetical protein
MGSDLESRFHAEWLGLVQPVEGLVVSVPVLSDAQCMRRQPLSHQQQLAEFAPAGRIADLTTFLAAVLDWTPDLFDVAPTLPDDLSLYVPEGHQTLRPTIGLRYQVSRSEVAVQDSRPDDSTPASSAGAAYVALLWDLPPGLPLDKPETTTGSWEYPPAAKFDRLLRACRVPIGLLTNREVVRLVYAPHGESSGHITFRLDDMASVAGRSIFDAFVMLLSAERFFGVAPEHQLPALLRDSRTRQANVTNELADQMLDALHGLLAGFVAAAERDGRAQLDEALAREDDHVYKGLLTVLLRLVFLLYAEDRALLPIEHPAYAASLSALGLFEQLQRDHGEWPDSMARRFGAWPRLVALFRAVFLGLEHGDLTMPARRGELFDPHRFPFLEGWGPAGAAPLFDTDTQGRVHVPTLDDETVFRVLEKLLVFQGQRLSYRALDVEQIGAVYEALMGYHVVRLTGPSVCLKGAKVWVVAADVLVQAPAQRGSWLAETAALAKSAVTKLVESLRAAKTEAEAMAALDPLRVRGSTPGRAGQLVIQPGAERRRTSSHYTPPSLTAPIVRRTLEPLLAAMGEAPASERLLDLKVCDPAMGSGAFLVEACRFLADQVVAAWTREGRLDLVASAHGDVVLHARRLVAQRCLYGVDKNPLAVSLARLSQWLVTLAKDEPFTFVDHALRHGDSLVGLDLEQIRAFHWKPGAQLELARELIDTALQEALESRQRILTLAPGDDVHTKEHLLWDANDALSPVRLIGDLVVGAFFAHEKDKARETERKRRLDLVVKWLESREAPTSELLEMQRALRERVPAFHWWMEFPEVFYGERPDPLDGGRVNRVAWMDAFVGNPPFLGGSQISTNFGSNYVQWLLSTVPETHGNADLSVYFLRRIDVLLGASGTGGVITTKTVSQGDSRSAGLRPMLASGVRLYFVISSFPWPGAATVSCAVVHWARGKVSSAIKSIVLDGIPVEFINSQMLPASERSNPLKIKANLSMWYMGSNICGEGFMLDRSEAMGLIAHDTKNAGRILPLIGGAEINGSPTQEYDRYVIFFGKDSLAEADKWPELMDIVRERVKPTRDKLRGDAPAPAHRKKYWWQFSEPRPELFDAIHSLNRCLVNSQVSKHIAFAFQPTDRVFAHTLYVYPIEAMTFFAIVQSRVHQYWTLRTSSTMGDAPRYSPSDCFETFPFPQPEPRAVIPALEEIGERLYTTRAKYMIDTQQGLTQTYNQLKAPRVTEARVVELRRLHEEMDRAVLAAYGWDDVKVPPYGTPVSDEEKKALERFEDEVIDRLFALNAKRAEEERQRAEREAATKEKPAKSRGGRKKKGSEGDGQGDLGIG